MRRLLLLLGLVLSASVATAQPYITRDHFGKYGPRLSAGANVYFPFTKARLDAMPCGYADADTGNPQTWCHNYGGLMLFTIEGITMMTNGMLRDDDGNRSQLQLCESGSTTGCANSLTDTLMWGKSERNGADSFEIIPGSVQLDFRARDNINLVPTQTAFANRALARFTSDTTYFRPCLETDGGACTDNTTWTNAIPYLVYDPSLEIYRTVRGNSVGSPGTSSISLQTGGRLNNAVEAGSTLHQFVNDYVHPNTFGERYIMQALFTEYLEALERAPLQQWPTSYGRSTACNGTVYQTTGGSLGIVNFKTQNNEIANENEFSARGQMCRWNTGAASNELVIDTVPGTVTEGQWNVLKFLYRTREINQKHTIRLETNTGVEITGADTIELMMGSIVGGVWQDFDLDQFPSDRQCYAWCWIMFKWRLPAGQGYTGARLKFIAGSNTTIFLDEIQGGEAIQQNAQFNYFVAPGQNRTIKIFSDSRISRIRNGMRWAFNTQGGRPINGSIRPDITWATDLNTEDWLVSGAGNCYDSFVNNPALFGQISDPSVGTNIFWYGLHDFEAAGRTPDQMVDTCLVPIQNECKTHGKECYFILEHSQRGDTNATFCGPGQASNCSILIDQFQEKALYGRSSAPSERVGF